MSSSNRLTMQILFFCACMVASQFALRSILQVGRVADLGAERLRSDQREVMYLPNGNALTFMSFGFRNVMGNLLWFRTVDYFGKHYATDRNYTWLAHMCDLVTTLTPRTPHVYQFCGNMLSWEANAPTDAVKVLDKAVVALPNDWRFAYHRGIVHSFFLHDFPAAQADFLLAAAIPGAHPMVKRLAAKAMAQNQSPELAIEFLDSMIRQEQDPIARRALEARRTEIVQGKRF